MRKSPCAAAAVYTQKPLKGAPIAVLTKRNIADGMARAVICKQR